MSLCFLIQNFAILARENVTLKGKVKRAEDEIQKRDKEIEKLLNYQVIHTVLYMKLRTNT